jgi:hypothetical protein
MNRLRLTRAAVMGLITRLDESLAHPGRLYLIGETTQVVEGWRAWTTQVEFLSEVAPEDQGILTRSVRSLREQAGVALFDESPAEVIPLPGGYEARHREVEGWAGERGPDTGKGPSLRRLSLFHFDPYSVALRFIARGDEPDYHMVLVFLEQGWISVEEMDVLLAGWLPRLTAETIQQDPAEFRRKYTGLLQMWRTVRPRTVHRSTTV